MENLRTAYEPIACILIYPSYVDTKPLMMNLDRTDNTIIERKRKNPRKFIVSDSSHITKGRGRGRRWVAFLDVEGRRTINIETGKPLTTKEQVKIDTLTFKAFWEARTAIKRDLVLLGFAVLSGAFIPFLLKWISSIFGRQVPW